MLINNSLNYKLNKKFYQNWRLNVHTIEQKTKMLSVSGVNLL